MPAPAPPSCGAGSCSGCFCQAAQGRGSPQEEQLCRQQGLCPHLLPSFPLPDAAGGVKEQTLRGLVQRQGRKLGLDTRKPLCSAALSRGIVRGEGSSAEGAEEENMEIRTGRKQGMAGLKELL